MPTISIVSPYYNRKKEIYKTLQSINKSTIKDIEYIIIDDASSEDQRIDDLLVEFPFIKLFRITPQEKTHINPCVPFNMGIAKASSDIIILQSPECLHVGDVLQYAYNNLTINDYMVFSCFSLSQQASKNLDDVDFSLDIDVLKNKLIVASGGLTEESAEGPMGRNNTWFAHPIYRRCLYNFLVALPLPDMIELGGFDERMAFGHGYDDTDFSARVVKKGMKISMVEDPFCLHQYHRSFLTEFSDFKQKELRNRLIYEESLKNNNYKIINSYVKDGDNNG